MELAEFLEAVVTTDEGYFQLSVRNHSWKNYWYEWPTQLDVIVDHASQSADDTYFAPHLFKSKDAHKDNVLPSRTIPQDLDNADVSSLALPPTVLVQTSPGRHQGFWVATAEFDDLSAHEALSKRLCYSIPLCDRSGWPPGHKFRVPGTLNKKYLGHEHLVTIVRATNKLYNVDELELLPDAATSSQNIPDSFEPPTDWPRQAILIVEDVKDSLSAKVYAEFHQDAPAQDRSASLFALETQLFRAGLSREEVYWVARHSPNDKFHADLRYNADRELAKDVLRAEVTVKSVSTNIRELINEIRKRTKTLQAERRRTIYEIVLTAMQGEGDFVHVQDGRRYYIPRETGHPIEIEMASSHLHSLLDVKYALNATEPEHHYTMQSLMSYTEYLPEAANVGTLSSYDYKSGTCLIHTGRKDVVVVDKSGLSMTQNGQYNLLFPWDRIVEPFTPSLTSDIDWGSQLFDIPNVLNMTPEEARCVLKVWLLFALLRDAATSRPILSFFGQPGCLAADTEVRVRHGKHFQQYTLENLYTSFNDVPIGGSGNWRIWNKKVPTEVLSLDDGAIEYRPIQAVSFSGRKPVRLVITTGDRMIKATTDHRFMTPSGYVPLTDLNVGDTILARGDAAVKQGKRYSPTRKRVSARYHPYGTNETVAGKVYPRIYYSKAVVEADMNGMPVDEYIQILQTDPDKAATFSYLPQGVDVHHKDEDINNNSLDNLEVVGHNDHARRHSPEAKYRFGNMAPIEDKIRAILDWGEEDTYDITMEGEPNFVANELVVHNSGKTSTARRLYAFFYGRHMDVSGATSPVNYDISTATLPFYVLDNLDTWEKWIPDRLAQSAGKSDILVRKLYTNQQTVRIKRQAMVCVTAHDPKFGRADVTDRMLILTLQRFSNMNLPFKDEGTLLNEVIANRNKLWGAVISDLAKVLRTPLPPTTDLQLRIQDFARLGEWIAIALGEQEVFRSSINSLQAAQRVFNLDEDHILITSLQQWLSKSGSQPKPKNQDDLYREVLSLVAPEDFKTFLMLYKNSSVFTKRISNLQDTLNTIMTVSFFIDKNGQRMWLIGEKETDDNN